MSRKGPVPKGSGACPKCGTIRFRLHRDHIVPRWKGGPDESSNIQYLCANCHEDKTCEDMKGKPVSEAVRLRLSEHTQAQWKGPGGETLRARLTSPEEAKRRSEFAKKFWADRRARGLTGAIELNPEREGRRLRKAERKAAREVG